MKPTEIHTLFLLHLSSQIQSQLYQEDMCPCKTEVQEFLYILQCKIPQGTPLTNRDKSVKKIMLMWQLQVETNDLLCLECRVDSSQIHCFLHLEVHWDNTPHCSSQPATISHGLSLIQSIQHSFGSVWKMWIEIVKNEYN